MQLTRERASALGERIGPIVSYLFRLRVRMTKVGFPIVDPLYPSVRNAEVAARDLATKLHYLICASGVGWPPDERSK